MGNKSGKEAAPAGQGAGAGAPVASGPDEDKVENQGQAEEISDEDLQRAAQCNENADESYSFWDRNKTFKPKSEPKFGAKQDQLSKTIKATMRATLGGGELQKSVQLPAGEDENEWIAVNTVHFYNAANMVYGACSEYCTEHACPVMTAGVKYEYLWKDGVRYKKPTRLSAPQYIDNLLNWVSEQISDPALFPVDDSAKFPRNFRAQVKVIFKRLFRLYAHVYYSHFDQLKAIGANAHLNTCFKHFVFFVQEFKLIDEEEMQPLKKLIDRFSK